MIIDTITYRDGFRLNGNPATREEILPIYESRKEAALATRVNDEKNKSTLSTENLPSDENQKACCAIAKK
ncbi:hypothetical protein [Xenorhabdus japonica]|uniref:Uncharacterized protein n=1 Tax=Xenorhabdus japonica TaxID=53341 RepID=A0A1I5DUP6_9GAMM|nr:hypothetical protein [Xenorhabdus japonica]SFO02982.1 hypothetical protein SAMN05421579_14631 [Xenorhabdus japonica]